MFDLETLALLSGAALLIGGLSLGVLELVQRWGDSRGVSNSLVALDRHLNELEQDRDELLFHLDWAKSRGESRKEIDLIQRQIAEIHGRIEQNRTMHQRISETQDGNIGQDIPGNVNVDKKMECPQVSEDEVRMDFSDPSGLKKASREYLHTGSFIYVRGKEAQIVDEDFPIVFWKYLDSQRVLHRNFLTCPEIFEVPEGAVAHADDKSDVSSEMEISNSFHEEFATPEFDADFSGFDQDDSEIVEQDNSSNSNSTAANMLAAFSRKVSKYIVSNEVGEAHSFKFVQVHARIPQGVHIESCLFADVSVSEKVSNISLVDIDHMKLDFVGVISSLELLRADKLSIVCRSSCSTIQIESCHEVDIYIPFTIPVLKVLCTNSTRVKVFVQSFPEFPEDRRNDEIDEEMLMLDLEAELDALDSARQTTLVCTWDGDTREKEVYPLVRDDSSFPSNL